MQAEMTEQKLINFHKTDKLLWLIDDSNKNHRYSLTTIEHCKQNNPDIMSKSYENYLNYVNCTEKYLYTDWRLPTKEELLSLALSDSYTLSLFYSKEKLANEISIDQKIFYDHKNFDYWVSTRAEDFTGHKRYVTVNFDGLRFKENHMRNNPNEDTIYGVQTSAANMTALNYLRLVRDLKH